MRSSLLAAFVGVGIGIGLAATTGCKADPPPAPVPPPTAPLPAAPSAPIGKPVDHHGLAWYEDDIDDAFAEAQRRGVPVLVDMWAPWCHSCLSMKNYVLTAANFPKLGERVVLLAVNTEKPEAAALLTTLPVSAWPTFYVADAKTRAPALRWVGSASPAQFVDFVDDGVLAAAPSGETEELRQLGALRGAAALEATAPADAAARYLAAVAAAPADWNRRPDALVGAIASLARAKDAAGCAALGAKHQAETGAGVSAADFAIYTVDCASELPAKDAGRKAALAAVLPRLTALCEVDGTADLTPDDRGEACRSLADARTLAGDQPGAKAALERTLAILGAAAEAVPDDVALTFDGARTSAFIDLGRFDEALAMLAARKRALPDSYLPPQYEARVYRAQKRWADALVAYDQAIARAYGPRKVQLLAARADTCKEKKDRACEQASLTALVAANDALPEAQRREALATDARARLGGPKK